MPMSRETRLAGAMVQFAASWMVIVMAPSAPVGKQLTAPKMKASGYFPMMQFVDELMHVRQLTSQTLHELPLTKNPSPQDEQVLFDADKMKLELQLVQFLAATSQVRQFASQG